MGAYSGNSSISSSDFSSLSPYMPIPSQLFQIHGMCGGEIWCIEGRLPWN